MVTKSSKQTLCLLEKKPFWRFKFEHLILILIMLLSAALHFSNSASIGDANAYYTAGVKSMLQSWHNFFFVAAEPGGSVTIDKPPLGFWIETAFAYLFGLSGFTVSLPNMIAGILSLPLIFHLTKRYFGSFAGISAALIYTLTPVLLAADRNNTIDGMLVFTLLLAAWMFIKAVESGKFGHLLVASILVGLAFNIKMLQAFLPLPAFFIFYFVCSKIKWGRRIIYLGVSALIILLISFSWALIVDFTPVDQRPFVGSSENNTVSELIIGHNGLGRLFGLGRNAKSSKQQSARQVNPNPIPRRPDGTDSDLQGQSPGVNPQRPAGSGYGPAAPVNTTNQKGGAFSDEIGQPGPLRFFQSEIGNEISWLLPFGLAAMVWLLFSQKFTLRELSHRHKGLLLWGTWLLTCLIFFSIANTFHAYYMIMLAPPLAVLCGAIFGLISEQIKISKVWEKILFGLLCVLTIAFQIFLALYYIPFSLWMLIPVLISIIGIIALLIRDKKGYLPRFGLITMLIAVLVIPAWWTVQTVWDEGFSQRLPAAYAGETKGNAVKREKSQTEDRLLDFLQDHTQDIEYLVAVDSAQIGSPIVLDTGRPVLFMGGFTGGDEVIDVDGLAQMIADNELRFVFTGSSNRARTDINQWLKDNCVVVRIFSPRIQQQTGKQSNSANVLFDCQPG